MYILNIGLNNNPRSFDDIAVDLDAMFTIRGPVAKALGEWDGNSELTLVAYVAECDKKSIELLCKIYTQECIAVWSADFNDGWLVYKPSFEGERYTFDKEYFLM
jgi:hypothetical protein